VKKRKITGVTLQTEVAPLWVPNVKERKLGKEQNYGQYWCGTSLIEIDPRQKSQRYLKTLIHEMLHMYFPDLNEKTVEIISARMATAIWNKNYRKITS